MTTKPVNPTADIDRLRESVDLDDLIEEVDVFMKLLAEPGPGERKALEAQARIALESGRVSVHDAISSWQRGWIDDERAMHLSGCSSVAELYQAAYSSDIEIRFARPVVVKIDGVMSGDPVIAGTRVLAETIFAEIASGATKDQIMSDHPTLPPGSILAVYKWAHNKT